MYDQIKNTALFNMDETIANEIFEDTTYPWEVLSKIKDFLPKLGESLSEEEYDHPQEEVWIAKSAKIAPNVTIAGSCIIGKNTEVRPGAFIRGNAIVGENCVVGNSTELKNVLLFNNVQVPHYNYVGDSILGYKSHMGAGSITSNVKSDKTNVTIRYQGEVIETGLRKMGAILGNYVEIGCNSVLNPGSIIGSNSNVYPLSMIRGFVPKGSIYKRQGEIVSKKLD
ncbi:MAG: UDP-N-acetylglucosamine pyrophosphorylase [Butyribacter sp.]|nr:UDP-N-acetylglucosamine pyrophosphorylase [bacterium]MDY3853560.1 UDP-N-acetylglucosamine pyrophosphorylase [Butyribacter sp.]